MENNELLNKYDQIVNVVATNLYHFAKESSIIVLKEFDGRNPEHLFLLHIALTLKCSFGFEMEIDCGLLRRWYYNHKFKKVVGEHRRNWLKCPNPNHFDATPTCDEILDKSRAWSIELLQDWYFNYGLIYKEYFTDKK